MSRLLIRGGYVLDPETGTDGVRDVYCRNGRISEVGVKLEVPEADHILDAEGCLVIPGAVDLAACLSPLEEQRPSVESEIRAASAGGITTVCSVAETLPVPDSPAAVHHLLEQAHRVGGVRLEVLGAAMQGLGETQLASLGALRQAGCAGVSNGLRPYANLLVLRRVMDYAASQDLTLFYHPLDHTLAGPGGVHDGEVAARLGLPTVPPAAEAAALAQMMALVQDTGTRVHFCRLSCEQAVEILEIGLNAGLPVSADVAVHQLFLTEEAVEGFDANAHVVPPLRTARDRECLLDAVRSGVISSICSDHMPRDPDSKMVPFVRTRPGISGLETLVPLAMTLASRDILPRATVVERISTQPARILKARGGTLAPGARADLCMLSLDTPWTFAAKEMYSAGRNSPFDGWKLPDRVEATICAGQVVYSRQEA